VFRQFYKERDVVKEERRMRTESTPSGRLIEQFLAAAFTAHPYGMPAVGYMSDLDSFSMTDAQAFYRKYYVPSNLYTSIVGDVKAAEVIPILEKYFGGIPKGDPPPPVRTLEPEQTGERVVKINDPGQPLYLEGYHRPSGNDPDRESYIALASVLGGGGGGFGGGGGGNRTARLYRSLVRDKQLAAVATVFDTFPGDKYPNLMVVLAVPGKGHTVDEVRDAVRAELKRIASEEIGDDELARVKAKAKADLVRSFQGNSGLAFGISIAQARYGDWRELFRTVERLDKVTKADVLRVARATFKDTNRTVGYIETTPASAPKPAPSGE
jgi:predicted Zn-dependent peptidase